MLSDTALAHYPLFCDVPVTLLLFLVGMALGRRLLARIRLPGATQIERGLFAMALGIGLLTYLPFALFAVGLGKPLYVAVAVIVLAAALIPDMLRILRAVLRYGKESLSNLNPPALAPVWALAIGLLLSLTTTFLLACCPPTDADGLYYHLTAPKTYLAAGQFFYMPTFLHVNWPLGVEMLFGLGMAFHAHYAAGLIQYAFGLLVLMTIYALGKRVASPLVGALAVGLTFPLIRGEMTWAYIDIGFSFYTLTALYAFFLGWQNLHAENASTKASLPNYWTLSALLAGLSATAKLPGVLTVVLLAAMLFSALTFSARNLPGARSSEALQNAARYAILYFALGLLVVIPWYLRSWALTGTPIYPYFGSILTVRDWSPEFQRRLTEYFQVFNTFRSRNLSAAHVMQLRTAACAAVALVGALFTLWRGTKPTRPLFFFLFASIFLQIAISGIYTRYFLYVVPLLAVLVFWLMRNILMQYKALQWIAVALVVLKVYSIPHVASALRGEFLQGQEDLRVALGAKSREAYLSERLACYPMLQWANENLPPNATLVLGILDASPSLLDRRAMTTNPWTQDALRFDSEALLLEDMKRLGATHLLLHEDAPPTPQEFARLDKEAQLRATWERPKLIDLVRQYGKVIHTDNGYILYELNLPH